MKLAILILGDQNSGKTSTIKHLVNTHSDKNLAVMRAGWNSLFLNSIYKSLKLTFFCVPASPTETKKKLDDRFKNFSNLPQNLIIAEQLNGSNYSNTMQFLNSNNYHIIQYTILNTTGNADWERFNGTNSGAKLTNRTNQIITDIKGYIRSNGII